MAQLEYALCPRCGKESNGKSKVELFFGFRNNAGNLQVQSYCKQCRSGERAEKRLAKKQNK